MSAVGRQARANLRSARRQTFLVGVTVVGAAALLALALATFGVAGDAYERLHERVNGAHLWLDLDPQIIDGDDAASTVAALPGVEETSEPRYSAGTRLRVDEQQQWLMLRDWPGSDVEVARVLVVDGRAPASGQDAVIALDRNLAIHLGVEVGEVVEMLAADGWREVEVVGRTVTADMCPAPMCEPAFSHLAPGGLAAVGLEPAPPAGEGRWAVGVRLHDPAAHAEVLVEAEATLPPGAIAAAWDHEGMAEFADFILRIQAVFLVAFGLVAAIAAGLLIGNGIAESVRADTRRIGLLKAVGFTRAQLARIYLAQHLGVALVASLLGVVAGSLVGAWSLSAVTARFGETGGGLGWWAILLVPTIVVAIAGVATWWPLRRATRVDVVTAIRTGAASVRRHPARLSRLPVPLATALVDLRARPGRTLVTAGTVALAAITLAFASTVVTTLDSLTDDPGSGLAPAGELTLERPEVLADDEVRALLAAEPGIAAVQAKSWLQWQQVGGETRYGAFAADGDLDAFPAPLLEGRGVNAAGEAMIGFGLASHLDLVVGDVLPVVVAGQRLDLEVVGTYRELFNMGRMFTIHADTLAAIGGPMPADGYDLAVTPGFDPATVAQALTTGSDGLLAAELAESFAAPVLDSLPAVMIGLSVLLGAIALVGVLNTVWAAVQERTRELGLLVAVGMRGRQLIASVLSGAGVTAVLGVLVGVPVGVVLTRLLLDGLGRNLGFGPLEAMTAPVSLAAVLPVLLVVAVLGALPPAVRAARLPVADALRNE